MKIVHINKKDIDQEQAYLEEGRSIMLAQAESQYKRFLLLRAKKQAVQNTTSSTSGNNAKNLGVKP